MKVRSLDSYTANLSPIEVLPEQLSIETRPLLGVLSGDHTPKTVVVGKRLFCVWVQTQGEAMQGIGGAFPGHAHIQKEQPNL